MGRRDGVPVPTRYKYQTLSSLFGNQPKRVAELSAAIPAVEEEPAADVEEPKGKRKAIHRNSTYVRDGAGGSGVLHTNDPVHVPGYEPAPAAAGAFVFLVFNHMVIVV